jgi:SAM-dependent methyltransferase
VIAYPNLPSSLQVPQKDLPASGVNRRGSIISLLRGAFACPTIATLAELGILDRMLASPFSVEDITGIQDREALMAVFVYLQSLGLLDMSAGDVFSVTDEGKTVLKRGGAFLLLHSYREYFNHLGTLLQQGRQGITVDRAHNVLGSGSLHSRKFFPAVWEVFDSLHPEALIDVGCGDGQFLDDATARDPQLVVSAVDLSPIAVNTTIERLRAAGRTEVVGVVESGEEIERWIEHVPESVKSVSPLVISMWFVIHEFSGGDVDRVIRFFQRVAQTLPQAHFVVGEIVNLDADMLREGKATSIMPEFLLFHQLSGQGVLSWEEWQLILEQIPYELSYEARFDEVVSGGTSLPSSFVWHLTPSKPS